MCLQEISMDNNKNNLFNDSNLTSSNRCSVCNTLSLVEYRINFSEVIALCSNSQCFQYANSINFDLNESIKQYRIDEKNTLANKLTIEEILCGLETSHAQEINNLELILKQLGNVKQIEFVSNQTQNDLYNDQFSEDLFDENFIDDLSKLLSTDEFIDTTNTQQMDSTIYTQDSMNHTLANNDSTVASTTNKSFFSNSSITIEKINPNTCNNNNNNTSSNQSDAFNSSVNNKDFECFFYQNNQVQSTPFQKKTLVENNNNNNNTIYNKTEINNNSFSANSNDVNVKIESLANESELLPWEISIKKKTPYNKYQNKNINSDLSSSNSHKTSGLLKLTSTPATITKQNLASKVREQKSLIKERGTLLKNALMDVNKSDTSNIMNKQKLFPTGGGYKDLVLNVLKKKTLK